MVLWSLALDWAARLYERRHNKALLWQNTLQLIGKEDYYDKSKDHKWKL